MSPRQAIVVLGAVSLSCGWAAVTLGSYLARRYPGAETPLRLLCIVLAVFVVLAACSLALLHKLSRDKR
jgi:hypothetical protein